MLRITTHRDNETVRLQVEGELVGVWVKELEFAWRSARSSLAGRRLQVDLTGTTQVDMAGQYLLALLHKENAQFLISGPWMRGLISEITARDAA
jgi:ABC-type transporter Mla MlaB component